MRVSAAFFSPLLSLKYITYSFFCLSALPVLSLLPCVFRPSLLPSTTHQARGHPCSSLPAFPPLVLRCLLLLPCVPWLVPSCLLCVRPEALRRPSVCRAVCRAACPSLVCCQAQNAVTEWADAPRIYPRPYPCPLVMCCRVFRCPFRGLSCLLPCVVWW